MKTIASIDFEWMFTGELNLGESSCQVGISKVTLDDTTNRIGLIDTFSFSFKTPYLENILLHSNTNNLQFAPNNYIIPEFILCSKDFGDYINSLYLFLNSVDEIISFGQIDYNILVNFFQKYNYNFNQISYTNVQNLFSGKLEDLCNAYNVINLVPHHPLWDSYSLLECYIKMMMSSNISAPKLTTLNSNYGNGGSKKIIKPTEEELLNAPNNIFKGKQFTVTGNPEKIERTILENRLVHEFGGTCNSSGYKKSDYIIKFKNFGKTKIQYAKDNNIQIISEKEIYKLLGIK